MVLGIFRRNLENHLHASAVEIVKADRTALPGFFMWPLSMGLKVPV
jgi:hypothetical protein